MWTNATLATITIMYYYYYYFYFLLITTLLGQVPLPNTLKDKENIEGLQLCPQLVTTFTRLDFVYTNGKHCTTCYTTSWLVDTDFQWVKVWRHLRKVLLIESSRVLLCSMKIIWTLISHSCANIVSYVLFLFKMNAQSLIMFSHTLSCVLFVFDVISQLLQSIMQQPNWENRKLAYVTWW